MDGFFVGSIFVSVLIPVVLITTPEFDYANEVVGLVLGIGFAFGISFLQLSIGKAVKEHKTWGRIAGKICGVLHFLFTFPIGILIGGYIFVVPHKKMRASAFTVEQRLMLVRWA